MKQKFADSAFFIATGHIGDYSHIEDLKLIRKAVKNQLDVEIGNTEAHIFWKWHSDLYDASFLAVPFEEEPVSEWFKAFCAEKNGMTAQEFDDDGGSPYEEDDPYVKDL